MPHDTKLPDKPATPSSPKRELAAAAATRRAFIRGVAGKALYVTPVVMTLTASQAQAAASAYSAGCLLSGAPCVANEDCCTTLCQAMDMVCECLASMAMCTADVECCSGVCAQPVAKCQ